MRNWDNRQLTIFFMLVGTPILFLIFPPTRPVMLATFGVFAHAILWLMECAMGAQAFGVPPVLMWAVLGGIIGACLGFWSVAPAVGRRRYRRIAGALPIALLGCLLLGGVMFSILRSPKAPSLAPTGAPTQQQPVVKKPDVPDPNNVPAPSLYSPPKEEILSTAPEGGGGDPHDQSVVPTDTAAGTSSTSTAGTGAGQTPSQSNNPVDRLRPVIGGSSVGR